MNECYKVVRIREGEFWSACPVGVFIGTDSGEDLQIGGTSLYRLDHITDALKYSLGIFVYSAERDPSNMLESWDFQSPVALLKCECGKLQKQEWRIHLPDPELTEYHRFRRLSNWMNLRAEIRSHLPNILHLNTIHSRPVSSVPRGSYTTPWVIPRAVVCRIRSK